MASFGDGDQITTEIPKHHDIEPYIEHEEAICDHEEAICGHANPEEAHEEEATCRSLR